MRKLKMECSVTGRAFIRRRRTVKRQVKIFDTRRKFNPYPANVENGVSS